MLNYNLTELISKKEDFYLINLESDNSDLSIATGIVLVDNQLFVQLKVKNEKHSNFKLERFMINDLVKIFNSCIN